MRSLGRLMARHSAMSAFVRALQGGALALALLLLSGCGGGSGGSVGPSASGSVPTATSTSVVSGSTGTTTPAAMQEETYQGCPPQGDGGDTDLNLRKNRIDPAPDQPVSLQSLLALTWPRSVEQVRRSAWTPDDAAAVARNEGRAVTVEGYVLLVRHEGPESPNCHDATARDYHTWLATAPSANLADRAIARQIMFERNRPLCARGSRPWSLILYLNIYSSMVVEFTPRVVANNTGWGGEASLLRVKGRHVRISGWLMLDQEHPEQVGKTRGTLWEIHPITRVLVDINGAWQDLNTASSALGSAQINRQPAGVGPSGPGYTTPSPYHHRTRRTYHRRSYSSGSSY